MIDADCTVRPGVNRRTLGALPTQLPGAACTLGISIIISTINDNGHKSPHVPSMRQSKYRPKHDGKPRTMINRAAGEAE